MTLGRVWAQTTRPPIHATRSGVLDDVCKARGTFISCLCCPSCSSHRGRSVRRRALSPPNDRCASAPSAGDERGSLPTVRVWAGTDLWSLIGCRVLPVPALALRVGIPYPCCCSGSLSDPDGPGPRTWLCSVLPALFAALDRRSATGRFFGPALVRTFVTEALFTFEWAPKRQHAAIIFPGLTRCTAGADCPFCHRTIIGSTQQKR